MSAQVHYSSPVEGVAQLLLENGERNFSNWELQERLEEALKRARESGVRVVVIGSAVDGYFLAHGHIGNLVQTLTGGETTGDPRAGGRVQRELDVGPMVSIAAVDGQAWGSGAELAWACDLRVASSDATFAQPEILIGLTTGGGAARITQLAGEAAAKRLVLDGRPVSADEALRLGLVHRVVAAGGALRESLEWATWLAQRPPWALAAAKTIVTAARSGDLLEAVQAETTAFVKQFSRPEIVSSAAAAQTRYDEGADSYQAFLMSPWPPER